jgi:hypothetical protein
VVMANRMFSVIENAMLQNVIKDEISNGWGLNINASTET